MSPAPIHATSRGLFQPPARPDKWRVLLAVCLGLGMLMIDTFVVNVALPAIGRDLGAGLGAAEWTISGYVLAVGVLPVAMGRIGDLFGRRRVYLIGLVTFITASALCGLAASIEQLIAFRVLQGMGAAVMMPGTLSIITQAFPPAQRGLAIGIWGGVSGLGLIAGPILGGLLVRGDSWRWVFLVNLPVGLVALFMALREVPESRDEHAPRSVDWPGLTALSGALVLVMLAVTQANEAGWTSPLVLGGLIGGLLLLPVFVAVERRSRAPLVDLTLFRNVTFVCACLSAALFSAAVFGSQPYVSLLMQNTWGFSPLKGGLAFLPATVLVAALMPLSGIMGQRLGMRMRYLVLSGAVCVLLSSVLLLRLDAGSGYVDGLLLPFIIRGVGIGLFMSASSFAVMSSAPLAKSGLASGTLTMSRQIGTALGVALLGAAYLQHVDAAVPATVAALPPAESARVVAAAEHFVVTGPVELQGEVRAELVQGFVRVAGVSLVLAAIAAAATLFVRPRAGATVTEPRPGERPRTAPVPVTPSVQIEG